MLTETKRTSKTVNTFLEGWFKAKNQLQLELGGCGIPTCLSILQFIILQSTFGEGGELDKDNILAYTRALGITTVGDLWAGDDGWMAEDQLQGELRENMRLRSQTPILLLNFLKKCDNCTWDSELAEMDGWGWQVEGKLVQGWKLNMTHWRKLIPRPNQIMQN